MTKRRQPLFTRVAVEVYFLAFGALLIFALVDELGSVQAGRAASPLDPALIILAVMFGLAAVVAANVRQRAESRLG